MMLTHAYDIGMTLVWQGFGMILAGFWQKTESGHQMQQRFDTSGNFSLAEPVTVSTVSISALNLEGSMKIPSMLGPLFALLLLSGCSSASNLASLKIEGLKGVEFGQTSQEIRTALNGRQLSPQKVFEIYTCDICDGLSVSYDGLAFSPKFILRNDKLISVEGAVLDLSQPIITKFETDMQNKFGTPQSKDDTEIWQDAGMHVELSARDGNQKPNYNYIVLGEPTPACLAPNATRATHRNTQ